MTVNQISTTKMQIALNGDEVSSLFGSYDEISYDDPRTRCALNTILKKAITQEHFSLNSSRLMIEVRPDGCGCNIFLTKVHKRYKRQCRSKAENTYCAVFPNGNALLDGIETFLSLSKKKFPRSDLYRTAQGYALIFDSQFLTGKEIQLFREYCTLLLKSEHITAIATEYGTPIRLNDAVRTIADAIKTVKYQAT